VDPAMLSSATREGGEKKGHHVHERELKRNFLEIEYAEVHQCENPIRGECFVSSVHVQISGVNAVVSYDRSILKADSREVISKVRETRVWHHKKNGWINVHFVRRPI